MSAAPPARQMLPGLARKAAGELARQPPGPPGPVSPQEMLEQILGRPLYEYERRYLHGPIPVHDGGWELPAWLPGAIAKGRMRQIALEATAGAKVTEYDRMASLEAAVAVLYTASLVAPLDHDAVGAYAWAAAQVLARHGRAESPEMLLQAVYGVEEAGRYAGLDEPGRQLLDRLRRDIRRKVAKK